MLKGKVLVATGGGPTAVINESVVGVVIESRKIPTVERVYGAHFGIKGIIDEDFVDLTQETTHNLELVAKTPSSALGSTRDKPDLDYCKKIVEVIKIHQISTFFYIGGNDSSDTARIVTNEAKKLNYDLKCIHIPKTIDNDLVLNDHTPGYPSAARYVANVFSSINLDNRALPTIYVGVVMGRNSGFLTAASTVARKYPDDGPHLVYIPERTFDLEDFLSSVKEVFEKLGRCIIAVSEGIVDKNGKLIAEEMMKDKNIDQHGNLHLSNGLLAELLVEKIKGYVKTSRVRGDTLGFPQRTFIESISDVDRREAREVGEKAVQFAHWGNSNGSVVIKRIGNYSVEYDLVDLEEIAGKTRFLDDIYINEKGNDVTPAFYSYIRPLLGSKMPDSYRLRLNTVPKILKK